MANIKVSEMTEATSFDDGDYTMIVQANQNKKIAKENIFSDLKNEITTNATNISNINDEISDINTEISNIIESGSNANGNWIKYSDGTMICTAKKQITTTRNTTYGVLYVSPKINAFLYPETFITINSIVLNAEAQNNSVWLITADLGTEAQTPTFYIAGVTSAGSNTYYINYTAIGKWK